MNDKFIFDLANAPLCRREETERSGVARSSRDESCRAICYRPRGFIFKNGAIGGVAFFSCGSLLLNVREHRDIIINK